MNTVFVEGMEVIVRLHGAGVTTEEDNVVSKVDGNKVWLEGDNTVFINGKQDGIFGFWKELVQKE